MASLKDTGDVTATSHEKSSPPYDESDGSVELTGNADSLKRNLGNRQIQMIAIGGSIGTALFVSIGNGLIDGGPGSLFIAYALYSGLLGLVNNCMAEMAVFMPISGTYDTCAGRDVLSLRSGKTMRAACSHIFHLLPPFTDSGF